MIRLLTSLSALLWFCGPSVFGGGKIKSFYEVDLNRRDQDSFFVCLRVDGLKADTVIFQFAATAPGTYSVMDVGRFTGSFQAWAKDGAVLPVYRRGSNQYVIGGACRLERVTYSVEDSYDTSIGEHPVGSMSGSNIESDNVVINGQMVFGYFHGHQSDPIEVTFRYPSEWVVGTAAKRKGDRYRFPTFNELVDSPFMFGPLSTSQFNMSKARIDIYCYSQDTSISAGHFKESLAGLIQAADAFLKGLPVSRYAFLFHFRKGGQYLWGAWEHNYSSYYILPTIPEPQLTPFVSSVAAHEFFHIVTPLNIHSEVIEHFNFETPTPSAHLWLYEGTTEWAAHMMQVRGGLKTPKAFAEEISKKCKVNDLFDKGVSLVDLAEHSYGHLNDQYINIYHRGALVAMLLDMRLLELSEGRKGLRDAILELSRKYGPTRSFPEKEFFDLFVRMTYPEIEDFFDRYVSGTEPLPLKEYLEKAGFAYDAVYRDSTQKASLGKVEFRLDDAGRVVVKAVDTSDSVVRELGIQVGDEFTGFAHHGSEYKVGDHAMQQILQAVKPGDRIEWIVKREGEEKRLSATAGTKYGAQTHRVTVLHTITPDQQRFRDWWLTNR